MRPSSCCIALMIVCLVPIGRTGAQDATARGSIVPDSQRVIASRTTSGRRDDRITEAELAQPDIIGGNALTAVEMLRPAMMRPRLPLGSSTSEAAMHGQLKVRQTFRGRQVDDALGETAGAMTVSVNEGPLQSVDVLTMIAARTVREMRYLRPLDATGRFGVTASGGPVLIVYTMAP